MCTRSSTTPLQNGETAYDGIHHSGGGEEAEGGEGESRLHQGPLYDQIRVLLRAEMTQKSNAKEILRAVKRRDHGAVLEHLTVRKISADSTDEPIDECVRDDGGEGADHGDFLADAHIDGDVLANPDDRDTDRFKVLRLERTCLHWSVCLCDTEMIGLLLQHGASVNATDTRNQTPLHLAIQTRNREVFDCVLSAEGVDVHAEDDFERTPLHVAVQQWSVGMVEKLLHHGAEVTAQDRVLRTPLHTAAVCGAHTEEGEGWQRGGIIDCLINHGAEIDAVDAGLRTPLHWAAVKVQPYHRTLTCCSASRKPVILTVCTPNHPDSTSMWMLLLLL